MSSRSRKRDINYQKIKPADEISQSSPTASNEITVGNTFELKAASTFEREVTNALKLDEFSNFLSTPQHYDIHFSNHNHEVPLLKNFAQYLQESKSDSLKDAHRSLDAIESEKKKFVARRFSGWRGGIALNATLIGAVLLINTLVLIWATTVSKPVNGVSTFYSGDCRKAKNLEFGAHLVINILSTLLLGASNYAMQILSSPSRADIDKAHRQQKSLDIGIFSFRNFRSISMCRLATYILLLFSSLPLHFLYNSVLISSVPTINLVPALYVTPDYFNFTAEYTPPSWASSDSYNPNILPAKVRQQATRKQLKHLDVAGCNVISPNTGANIQNTYETTVFVQDTVDFGNSTTLITFSTLGPTQDLEMMYNVTDCWAGLSEADCELFFNSSLMACVIVANIVKCVIMILMVLRINAPSLVTLGDAIALFLKVEDPTTIGLRSIGRKSWVFRENITYASAKKHWGSSPSYLKWGLSILTCISFIGVATGLLAWSISAIISDFTAGNDVGFHDSNDAPHPSIWNLGFDQPSLMATISPGEPIVLSQGRNPFVLVLLVNTPQLALSIGYLLINNLLMDMHGASEWSELGKTKKPLRTTVPQGQQRSTYFLQLPYIYALPFMAIMIGMHYMASSSFFLVDLVPYSFSNNGNGTLVIDPDTSLLEGAGWLLNYSPLAIFCALLVSVILITLPITLSFRKLHLGIPMVGACSALISAACHPPPEEGDAGLLPVQWGVVKSSIDSKTGIGRCSISSGEVFAPVEGYVYT